MNMKTKDMDINEVDVNSLKTKNKESRNTKTYNVGNAPRNEQIKNDVNVEDFVYKPKPVYSFFKRLFDLLVSFVCLIILLIPFLIVSLMILIDDHKAAPIFVQNRVGKNGKIFKIFKFRTMCANAEEKIVELQALNEADGPVFKIKDDPRITKVGRLLRASNIDELPQLFNIFLGNMSFVGPRPALPNEVDQYRESDKLRLLVTPGLTCYWQATKNRNDVSFDEWMELDRKYIMERSVIVDIKLIFKTFLFLFKRSGY